MSIKELEAVGITSEDIDILIESLEAWESKDDASDMVKALLPTMMAISQSELEQLERQIEKDQARSLAAKKQRKEESVLLRAKLILLRGKMPVAV